MQEQQPSKPHPYSMLTSMYLCWQQYSIPAVYYHYLLAILPKMDKKQQLLLMTREVKSLKANTHPYHKIVNAIEARKKSLAIIRDTLQILVEYESTDQMDWPTGSNTIQLEFDSYSPKFSSKGNSLSKYQVSHQDPNLPILSPSVKQPKNKHKQLRLQQLLNHIRLYQRVTAQLVIMIAEWEAQLKENGYKDTVIQFQYHKEDYLQIVNTDTANILDQYQGIFQNNPFLMMKKIHQKTEYALIYKELKLSQEMVHKIYQCLNIIANHESDILKFRMLAKVSQTANRRKLFSKSTEINKIYMNYNNGHDYIIVKDSEAMKKSKIYHQPLLSKNAQINKDPQTNGQNRLKSLKNSILINPEARLLTIDRTVRKHPVKSNLMNLMYNSQSNSPDIYLKTPKKLEQSLLPSRKIKSQKDIDIKLKRNQSQNLGKQRSASMMLADDDQGQKKQFKANMSESKFRQRVEVKPVHGQNNIIVGQRYDNNREDEADRNRGLSAQKKLEVFHKLNSELKLKNKSYAEQRQEEAKIQNNKPAFQQNIKKKQPELKQEQKDVKPGQLSEESKISLIFEENIKQTEIVKYLRQKVFNNSPDVGFEEIQSVAKKLLAQKEFITFIRVECNNLMIAWLAVKFIEKDNTLRRSVFILYVRKFVRLSGFERKLLDNFVAHGYGLIRNQQKILYQIDLLDVVVRPLVKIKYKVNPTLQKAQIKKLMKKEHTLSQSRILKYHSYSKTSKYHQYCQHEKSYCQISYNFLELSKICIDKNRYIQAKADKISKLGHQIYRVSCIANQTDLVVARTLTDILALQKQTEIEKDSSFDSKCESNYNYIAVREGKVMRKFVNDSDQVVICEFVTVNGSIPQVRSIAMTKEDIKTNVLLLQPPYFMAIMNRDVGELKTLAVLEFSL